MFIIDRLALRVGGEKDEDEADTVGCCSLRVEHIAFPSDTEIQLDFLGKDSMRYFQKVDLTRWEKHGAVRARVGACGACWEKHGAVRARVGACGA